MILKYGSHAHDDNEVWFSIQKQAKHSEIGFSQHLLARWTIRGVLKANDVSSLTTKMNTLETAYSSDFQDLIFFDSDGSTELHHSVRNKDTISGVLVKSFQWLSGNPAAGWGSGTEYVTRRSYQIIVEAEILDSQNSLLQWYETVRLTGDGGQKWRMIGALTGPVQRQDLQQFTPYQVMQSGYAVGHLAYPIAPSPIWPFALHGDAKVEELITPNFGPVRNTEFGIRWNYKFESAVALTGGPTLI